MLRSWLLLGTLVVAGAGACRGDAPPPRDRDSGAEAGTRLEPLPGEEGSGPLVVFMGTSLTEGLGLEEPRGEAWPARVAELAREDGLALEVRNAGLSGETSAGALRRVDWVLDRPPDVFVLESGANDGLRGLPVSELRANLGRIFARVRERAPEARLVLVEMEAPTNLGPAYTSEFRSVFREVAREWDAVLVPFLLDGVAGVSALNQPDGIHPTAEGHRRMAATAWPVLRPVLEEVGGAR